MGVKRALIVGYGHWGRVLARNVCEHDAYELAGIVDPDAQARVDAKSDEHPAFADLESAMRGTECDCVLIAAPIPLQVPLAIEALAYGKSVLIAKPGARTIGQVRVLDAIARDQGVSVVTDYTMLCAEPFNQMREAVAESGWLERVDTWRFATGTRTTESIIDDMLVHDIAMCCALTVGEWRVASCHEFSDKALVVLTCGSTEAHLRANRAAVKQKRMIEVAYGDWNSYSWDQLEDADNDAVKRRLSEFVYAPVGADLMMSRVAAILEACHA